MEIELDSAGHVDEPRMTVPEFAARFGLPKHRVYQEINAGRLRVLRPTPRRTAITERAALEWLNRRG